MLRFSVSPAAVVAARFSSRVARFLHRRHWLLLGVLMLGVLLSGSWGLLGTPVAAENPDGVLLSERQLESRARIARDLEYLASDQLRGRDTGSAEIDLAAEYLAARFRELGMNTELFEGTPFQPFTALREVVAGTAEENYLVLTGASGEVFRAELDKNIRPLGIGASGKVGAPLVFVGYGITAPDANYDDYAGVDVQGKIVVMLRGEPRRGRSDNPLGARGSSRFALFTTKIANAIEHGAAAVLLVNHADAASQMIQSAEGQLNSQRAQLEEIARNLAELSADAVNVRAQLENQQTLGQGQLGSLTTAVQNAPEALMAISQAGQSSGDVTIPVAALGRIALQTLLQAQEGDAEKPTLESLESEIDEKFQPRSFVFDGLQGDLSVSVSGRDVVAKNVVAELPGAGPLAEQTVVIGAHYDHVGMGGGGSLAPGTIAIHNGADDNGSGTCTLLEVAHRLAQDQSPSRRRFVFICFTAEERGLLGSKHYAREPRFALEETVGMINLDMVGRLNEDEQLTVFGVGTSPQFESLVDQWNSTHQLPLRKDPSGYGPSDHTSFYEKNIPVLFFFTGLHPDYHRPSDDFDKINLDGMVRITDMVCDAAMYLATVPERPPFQTTGPGEGVRPGRRGAYLGVSLEDSDGGVKVTDVVSDGPAAAAGIKIDDRIVRLGDKETSSLERLQEVVGQMRAGKEITVVVRRGNDELTVTVTLGRRP